MRKTSIMTEMTTREIVRISCLEEDECRSVDVVDIGVSDTDVVFILTSLNILNYF